MKPYVKLLLVVAVFALWVMLNHLSSKNAPEASSGCCCDGGSCPITSPATPK
ncbi:MAG: hypothetical protein ABFD49_05485 [Armatimonadota bacterium]|nr:hypothetical protein [bacterium]